MTEIAERQRTTGEIIAEQTLVAFSQSTEQEPISTFTPESGGEMDLAEYHAGTIIRIEHFDVPVGNQEGPARGPEYIWYVIGDRFTNPQSGEEEVMVYDFMTPPKDRSRPQLQEAKRVSLFQSNPVRIQRFLLRNAKVVLEGRNLVPEGDLYRDASPVTKLDIMAVGVDLEKTQPLELPKPQRRLN